MFRSNENTDKNLFYVINKNFVFLKKKKTYFYKKKAKL